MKDIKTLRIDWLKKELQKAFPSPSSEEVSKDSTEKLLNLSTKFYEKGYSGLDIIQIIDINSLFTHLSNEKRYELLFSFNRVRKEFRNEKLLIMFILNFLFLSSDTNLENISFM